jgi:hypothetical protein
MTLRRAPSRRSCVSRPFLSGHLRQPNSNEVHSFLTYWLKDVRRPNQANVTPLVTAHRSGWQR